jgi:hypothetical protein
MARSAATRALPGSVEPQARAALVEVIHHGLDVLVQTAREPTAREPTAREPTAREPTAREQHAAEPLAAVILPDDVLQAMGILVKLRIPLSSILHALWIAYTRMVDQLLAFADDVEDATAQLARNRRLAEHALTRAYDLSAELVLSYHAAEHEREGLVVHEGHRGVLGELLRGGEVEQADAERALGIDLAKYHLCLVLWAESGAGVTSLHLVRFARDLARATRAGAPVLAADGPVRLWMWTQWSRPVDDSLLHRARAHVFPPPGVHASAGPAAPGIAGFRSSHRAAMIGVTLFGMHGDSWLCTFGEIAAPLLLTRDRDLASEFVHRTLGRLCGQDARSARLRETLRSYLVHGRSRIHAAEELHVSRNTVAYRIEQALDLVGHPLGLDCLDMRLALEIFPYVCWGQAFDGAGPRLSSASRTDL